MEIVFYILVGYMVLISLVGFVVMLVDKLKAQKNEWRISESKLLTIALLGGGAGIWIGMYTFNHKTRKCKFTMLVPLITVMEVFLLVLLYGCM